VEDVLIALNAPAKPSAAPAGKRSTGSVETHADLTLKRAIEEGKLPGPHIDVTGPYLEGPHSYFIQMHEPSSSDEARQMVSESLLRIFPRIRHEPPALRFLRATGRFSGSGCSGLPRSLGECWWRDIQSSL
jgi:hypothetical protein